MTEIKRLKDLEEFPELYLIDCERKLGLAKEFKERGVESFKKGNVVDAFYQFSDALKLLIILDGRDGFELTTDMQNQKEELLIQLYNNMAGCQILRKNWEFTIDLCDSVIMRDPCNVKALYRRGCALMEIEEYERSVVDFNVALEVSPENEAVKSKMKELVQRMKSLNFKYAQAMKKMFT